MAFRLDGIGKWISNVWTLIFWYTVYNFDIKMIHLLILVCKYL